VVRAIIVLVGSSIYCNWFTAVCYSRGCCV